MEKKITVSASILSCDLSNLASETALCERSGADSIHFDVMDGRFVEQITYGAPVLKWVKKACGLPVDVHLMVENPTKQIDYFAQAGADSITLHVESDCDIPRCLERIHELGARAAVAVKPGTSAERALDFIDQCDMILVMTVEPGYGGQSFMDDMMTKVKKIRGYALEHGYDRLDIQVDGGINAETSRIARAAGANVLVAGASLFKENGDMSNLIAGMRG